MAHDGGRIAGFYTLAPGSVKERRTLPGMRSDGSLPVLKLGRLAVDGPAQGRGLGTALVLDAFARCYAASAARPGPRRSLADPPEAGGGVASAGSASGRRRATRSAHLRRAGDDRGMGGGERFVSKS